MDGWDAEPPINIDKLIAERDAARLENDKLNNVIGVLNGIVDDEKAKNAALRAALVQARDAIKSVEWKWSEGMHIDNRCPYCQYPSHIGHKPSCKVSKALAATDAALKE